MRERELQIADAGEPAIVINPDGRSPVVLVCEHASNYIPASLDHLGLSDADRVAHIAWDIGAEAVARHLSHALDATLIVQRYSRLVYDCNRPPTAPGAMPEVSEVTEIPGNKGLSDEERQARTDQIYYPFHARVSEVLDGKKAPVLVTIHSFTPVYRGEPRQVELGILHDSDSRLADQMLKLAGDAQDYVVRRNDPYGPEDGVTHTLILHGIERSIANVMLEVRNDLISDEAGQRTWGDRLESLTAEALAAVGSCTVAQTVARS